MKIETFKAPWGETYKGVEVELGHYGNGTLSVQLTDEMEGPLVTASVNLQQYGIEPAPGCIYVPCHSEHQGMIEALVECGLVEKTGTTTQYGPFDAYAQEARLLPPFAPTATFRE